MTDGETDDTSHAEGLISSSVDIIRYTDRTIHLSPNSREKEIDLMVENTDETPVEFILVPLKEFKRNLTAYDEDSQMLNIIPKRWYKEVVDELAKEGIGEAERVQKDMNENYPTLIQLPKDKPIEPGSLRTIRLEFEQSDQVNTRRFREICKDWRFFFFNIPYFTASVTRSPQESHDIFVVVVGTPGYGSIGESDRQGENPAETTNEVIHENGLNDNTRNLSIRLPPPAKQTYSVQSEYSLIPNGKGLLATLAAYWVIAVVIGSISVAVVTGFIPGDWFNSLSGYDGYQTTLSAAFITGTVGIITALRYEWADRYRMLCVVPVVVHALSWVLWNNTMSPS